MSSQIISESFISKDIGKVIHLKMCNPEGKPIIKISFLTGKSQYRKNIANINTLYGLQDCVYKYIYGERCNLCDNLDEMFQYIKQNHPHITKIDYSDTFIPDGTYNHCETIESSCLSYAFTGKTYFETRFNAVISPNYDIHTGEAELNDDMNIYIKERDRLTSKEYKSSLEFLQFVAKTNFYIGLNYMPLELDECKQLYNDTETIPEFVKAIDGRLKELGMPLNDRFRCYRYWIRNIFQDKSGYYLPTTWEWSL